MAFHKPKLFEGELFTTERSKSLCTASQPLHFLPIAFFTQPLLPFLTQSSKLVGQAMPMKKRAAPAGGAGAKKAKKGELPPVAPDALAMPHMKLLDEWVNHG